MTTSATPPRATIIHGYGATPADHWFGWLAARLAEAGWASVVPALPEPDSPDPDRWLAATAAAVGTPGAGDLVVGHSLGCLTVLRHLAGLPGDWRLGRLVLVAGFVDPLPALPGLDPYVAGAVAGLDRIASRTGEVTVLRSDADAYVPAGHTDRLAHLLGVPVRVVPGAGHFLAEEGVTTLPAAL
ncbi:alpha/beta hydrolase [Nocardioides sp. WV_118_6]